MRNVKGTAGLSVSGEQQSKKQAIIFRFSHNVWGGQEKGAVVTNTLRLAGKIPGYRALLPIRLSLGEEERCTELQYFSIAHAVSPLTAFQLRCQSHQSTGTIQHRFWKALLSNGSYLSTSQTPGL